MKLLLAFAAVLAISVVAKPTKAKQPETIEVGVSNPTVVMAKRKCRRGFRYDRKRKLCISIRGSF